LRQQGVHPGVLPRRPSSRIMEPVRGMRYRPARETPEFEVRISRVPGEEDRPPLLSALRLHLPPHPPSLLHALFESTKAELDIGQAFGIRSGCTGPVHGRSSAPYEAQVTQRQGDGQGDGHHYEPRLRHIGGDDPAHPVEHREDAPQKQPVTDHRELVGSNQGDRHGQRCGDHENDARGPAPGPLRFPSRILQGVSLLVHFPNL